MYGEYSVATAYYTLVPLTRWYSSRSYFIFTILIIILIDSRSDKLDSLFIQSNEKGVNLKNSKYGAELVL